MSDWTATNQEPVTAPRSPGERQRLTPVSVTKSSPGGGGGSSRLPTLAAKAVLMIWTLFMLGFVLILCAAIAYSAGFSGAGTGCLVAGVGCLVVASVWQWRVSGARLELGRSAGYPQMPAPGAGGAFNIQGEPEGPPAAFHF